MYKKQSGVRDLSPNTTYFPEYFPEYFAEYFAEWINILLTRIFLLHGTTYLMTRWRVGTSGRGNTRCSNLYVFAWLRMGRVPLRERAAAQLEYLMADLPDDVMEILKAGGL